MVELETDKVNIEVPSPFAGTLLSIKVKEGSTVEVGSLLGFIKEGKLASTDNIKEEYEKQKAYVPPKKKEHKQTVKKRKKTSLTNQTSLKLVDLAESEDKSEEPLILETLADNAIVEQNLNADADLSLIHI